MLADAERDVSSCSFKLLSIILLTPLFDTILGTLRHTSLRPNSPSSKVETVNTLLCPRARSSFLSIITISSASPHRFLFLHFGFDSSRLIQVNQS